MLEDAGAQTVSGWATAIIAGPGEAGQVLTFEITDNTNAALFSAGPAVCGTTGDLTYTPAANANGTATITLRLTDDGGTANGGVDASPTQTFVITVTAVNDAPSFTKGADQTVLEDAGRADGAGWATAISAGPADESGQTLTFVVTNNTNAALFSAAPAVNATNGTLTFTPAANANGTATITAAPRRQRRHRERRREPVGDADVRSSPSPRSTTRRASPRARTRRCSRTPARRR